MVAPSHPLLPPVEIMNEHEGSRYSWEMTPVRWPGTTRKGVAAVFCWRSAPMEEEVVWLRSYWRRMS